jgi:hypothetical protein
MPETGQMRARLQTAGELTEFLGVARETFSLLLAACRDCEERAAELFAAFALASAAAAQGRLVITSAPSLPAGPDNQTSYDGCVQTDLDKAADDLADLAGVLSERPSAAARLAHHPGDRAACQDAAAQAAQIHELVR